MPDIPLPELLHVSESTLLLLGVISLITFIGTLIVVPWLIVRIPTDYFAPEKRQPAPWSDQHPAIRWILLIAKNLFGAILVVMGIAMLVLPGQGLLTILIGLVLLNFPGKYRLERWLVLRRPILRAVNWLRRRGGRESLIFD
ncbi:MAG: PGPGW domain-containing protein [Gammaproteobacteria bacterium]